MNGQLPAQYEPAVFNDDGRQIQESASHGDVGYVNGLNSIGKLNFHATKQIQMDVLRKTEATQIPLVVDWH